MAIMNISKVKKTFEVYGIDKDPYGIILYTSNFEDAEKLIQEDIKTEKANGYDYTEDDYIIKPLDVYAYNK